MSYVSVGHQKILPNSNNKSQAKFKHQVQLYSATVYIRYYDHRSTFSLSASGECKQSLVIVQEFEHFVAQCTGNFSAFFFCNGEVKVPHL